MNELHISRIIFIQMWTDYMFTYESYACPFQNHNWTVLFGIHKFDHLYDKSIYLALLVFV